MSDPLFAGFVGLGLVVVVGLCWRAMRLTCPDCGGRITQTHVFPYEGFACFSCRKVWDFRGAKTPAEVRVYPLEGVGA